MLNSSTGKLFPNNQVNITKPLANRLNIKAGDNVNCINKEDGKSYTIQIDAIADSYAGQFIFMPLDEFNKLLKHPEESYMGLKKVNEISMSEALKAGTE